MVDSYVAGAASGWARQGIVTGHKGVWRYPCVRSRAVRPDGRPGERCEGAMTLGPIDTGGPAAKGPLEGLGAAEPAAQPWLRGYPAGIDWAAPAIGRASCRARGCQYV